MSPNLWRPVQVGGRVPFVVCVVCRARELNETNRLRRGGWMETAGGQRVFRCGPCSEEVVACHHSDWQETATTPRRYRCGVCGVELVP
jgi:ribosomal protein S27AE